MAAPRLGPAVARAAVEDIHVVFLDDAVQRHGSNRASKRWSVQSKLNRVAVVVEQPVNIRKPSGV
jgi:hypothetical protein